MTFHYRYRKQIILLTTIIILLGSLVATSIYFYEPKKEEKISSLKVKKTTTKKEEAKEEDNSKRKYMVDIKGEVNTPGIYELSPDARIIDVINEAGGLTDSADTTVMNLSKKIADEMVIIIYSKRQVENWLKTKEQEDYLQEKCVQQQEGQPKNNGCIEEKKDSTSTTININTATKEELMSLTGIGEAKADAIMTYRQQTPFTKIEDIKNVSGIGDNIYEEIKNNITV